MAIKLILADFDGTLADSMPCWAALPRDFLREAGLTEPEDMDELVRSIPMWEIARLFARRYPALGEQSALYERWLARMEENYRCRIPLKPGAAALLQALRREGMGIYILSATRGDLLRAALAHYGLDTLVDAVISEKDVGGSKRTEIPYRYCAEKSGAALSEMLLLEDSYPNLAAAAALGVRTGAVYDGTMAAHWDEMRALADVWLQSPAEGEKLLALVRASRAETE